MEGALQLGGVAWDDMPAPSVCNDRLRFWFTEDGWDRYGRNVVAEAQRISAHYHLGPVRVLRRKNPRKGDVAYRDRWQVALLPGRARPDRV